MTARLPPAIDANERPLDLPGCGRVFCYADESGAGTPVLLLHSINAAPSAREVRPVFEAFRGRRPVYAIDLPGFGRSERADRPYLPQFFADAVLAALASLVKGPVHALALSTTAEFLARAALERPEAFASLTMVSPTGLGQRNPPRAETRVKIHRFLRTPLLGRSLYRALRTRPSVKFFLGLAFEGAPPAALVDYACLTAALPGARFAPFYFLSGQLFDDDAVGNLYAPLGVPTLLLYDRDPNVKFDRLDELLAANPLWQARRIPGTRGLPQYDRPDETFSALADFWTANDPD